ncbi:hypothetical protein Tco_0871220 [Tanacetum coccineum]
MGEIRGLNEDDNDLKVDEKVLENGDVSSEVELDSDGEWEEVDGIGVEDFYGIEMKVVYDGWSHCCF